MLIFLVQLNFKFATVDFQDKIKKKLVKQVMKEGIEPRTFSMFTLKKQLK